MVALLYYQTFYKLHIVLGRKIDSDHQRVENAINHVTGTTLKPFSKYFLNAIAFLQMIMSVRPSVRPSVRITLSKYPNIREVVFLVLPI